MKYLSALVFGLLLMAFAVAPLYVVKPPASKAVAESTPRLVRYSFTLSNQTNQSIEHAVFKTFAPVKETAYQKVEWIRANEEFELREDSWGNQELEFLVQNLPPYGQKVITVTAQLQMWGQPRPWDKYRNISVGLDPIVEPSLPALQQALLEISHDPKAEVALDWIQKANSWVSKHLE